MLGGKKARRTVTKAIGSQCRLGGVACWKIPEPLVDRFWLAQSCVCEEALGKRPLQHFAHRPTCVDPLSPPPKAAGQHEPDGPDRFRDDGRIKSPPPGTKPAAAAPRARARAKLHRHFAASAPGLDDPCALSAGLHDIRIHIASDLDQACRVVGAALRNPRGAAALPLSDGADVAVAVLSDGGTQTSAELPDVRDIAAAVLVGPSLVVRIAFVRLQDIASTPAPIRARSCRRRLGARRTVRRRAVRFWPVRT